MDFYWIYITCANKEEALKIAHALVESKMIACANILDNMTAVYPWNNKIEVGQESVLICKTRKANYSKVKQKVEELHSYDCPCIIALPIERGAEAYLSWLSENTI
jgi:periplasmic divalent cation tolerance protein